jgi:hypothetical protein
MLRAFIFEALVLAAFSLFLAIVIAWSGILHGGGLSWPAYPAAANSASAIDARTPTHIGSELSCTSIANQGSATNWLPSASTTTTRRLPSMWTTSANWRSRRLPSGTGEGGYDRRP